MKDNDQWIEAALAAFPADDPLNPKRRELLADAALAVPPLGPSAPPPDDPPARFLARARTSRRRAILTNAVLFLTALGILWFQILSPQARRNTRRILVAADPLPGEWHHNDAVPGFLLAKEPHSALREEVRRRIPPEKHLLCLGDETAPDPVTAWKSVWETSPDDPVLFASYARVHSCFHNEAPQNLIVTGERIDPGNGYYRWIDFIQRLDKVIAESPSGRTREYAIADPDGFQEARSRLQEVLAAPRHQRHYSTLLARRFENWPPPHDFADLMIDLGWFEGLQPDTYPHGDLSDTLPIFFRLEAQRLQTSGDTQGMRILCREWRDTAGLLLGAPNDDNTVWPVMLFFSGSAWDMREASEALDLPTEVSFFERVQSPRGIYAEQHHDGPHGCFITAVMLSQTRGSVAPPTESEVGPARLAEHAMYERLILTGMTGLGIGILAFMTGLSFFACRPLARLPARLTDLLTPRDHLTATAIGLGLPLVALLLHLYIPVLHFREWPFQPLHLVLLIPKLIAFSITSLLLTTFVLTRGLAKRGRALGFSAVAPRRLLALALLTIASMTFVSFARFLPTTDHVDWETAVMGTLLLLLIISALFLTVVSVLCFTGHRKLLGATILRALTPYLVAIPLVFTLLSSYSSQRETYYVSQTVYERIGPGYPDGLTRTKRENAALLRKTYHALLDTAPE